MPDHKSEVLTRVLNDAYVEINVNSIKNATFKNTTDYLREGYRQLSDSKFYTKLGHDCTDQVATNVTKTLTKMREKGLISDKNFKHLNPTNCTEAMFYMLPKIHKKVYQADQFAVLLITPLAGLAN